MADDSESQYSDSLASSPQAVVDDASLQHSMNRNKESLKVKLMLRRPINQLIDQGILPPFKASPGFYEQSKRLERARMEDFLKHKILRRPDRQALIQKHILEDTTVSPSLQDKQRQLKKARLADDLNDRLSHRPGPLELVKGNILQADDRLAQAIKEGQIQFKATCEGEAIKHPPPLFHIEEESFSDSTPSPASTQATAVTVPSPSDHSLAAATTVTNYSDTTTGSSLNDFTSNTISSFTSLPLSSPATSSIILASPVTSLIPSPPLLQSQPLFVGNICTLNSATVKAATTAAGSTFVTFTPTNFSATNGVPAHSVGAQNGLNAAKSPSFTTGTVSAKSESKSESSKSRKKTKSKVQPKARTIKFHEYKGPPSAQRNEIQDAANSESSYELLLKQQQLFLQWQLEWQQKYPRQLIIPANQSIQKFDQQSGTTSQPSQTQTLLLATSSSKPTQQVQPEVIQINANAANNNGSNSATNTGNINNSAPTLIKANNATAAKQVAKSAGNSAAPAQARVISKLADMRVSDLKVELKKRSLPVSGSKPQLLDRLQPYASEVFAKNSSESDTSDDGSKSSQVSPMSTDDHDSSACASPATDNSYLTNSANFTLTNFAVTNNHNAHVQRAQLQKRSIDGHSKALSKAHNATAAGIAQRRLSQPLLSSVSPTVKASLATFLQRNQNGMHTAADSTGKQHAPQKSGDGGSKQRRANSMSAGIANRPTFDNLKKPPPNYEEATKHQQQPTKPARSRKKSAKSQDVDDVLDILIQNGELSPSAANEPQTPVTPITPRTTSNIMSSLMQPPTQAIEHVVPCKVEKDLSSVECKKEVVVSNPYDFSLELQVLANSMDFSALTQDNDHMMMDYSCDVNRNSTYQPSSTTNNISLCELLDFKPQVNNNTCMDWMSELAPATQVQEQKQGFLDSGGQQKISNQHDPVLPNSMPGMITQNDALIDDFLFDDNEFRGPQELGGMVWERAWDKLDFIA